MTCDHLNISTASRVIGYFSLWGSPPACRSDDVVLSSRLETRNSFESDVRLLHWEGSFHILIIRRSEDAYGRGYTGTTAVLCCVQHEESSRVNYDRPERNVAQLGIVFTQNRYDEAKVIPQQGTVTANQTLRQDALNRYLQERHNGCTISEGNCSVIREQRNLTDNRSSVSQKRTLSTSLYKKIP